MLTKRMKAKNESKKDLNKEDLNDNLFDFIREGA